MVLATDIDVKGTDGVWRPMTVLTALSMKPDDRKHEASGAANARGMSVCTAHRRVARCKLMRNTPLGGLPSQRPLR